MRRWKVKGILIAAAVGVIAALATAQALVYYGSAYMLH